MRTRGRGAFALVFAVTACGTTIHPRVNTGSDQPTGFFPGSRLSPREPDRTDAETGRPLIDEVCRTQGIRSGWIAIRYLRGAENCPESTDPDNPFTAAVIERYTNKPVGETMIVCADQPIPRDWVREHDEKIQATCEGARVPGGRPTVMVIRRVSARS